ncbi:type III pantothenate kinase [Thiomicrorhabdus heinhorstiae]|uniref:Type III pantothenate kinase n=1 Tax=Thiomicrorhabdus heinhorstiae TaxID=2748010 RepID=A0ABS0BXK1_9GAMM|nr:type III pantothenate kinase [Thiomicrorhabdus heinhorstiae]MBF6057576.1 type III pantothenate kinase [Thiomicrorhabdus heinhorstiae]
MNKLFLDLGNSRIKWASVYDDEYEYGGAESIENFFGDGNERILEEIGEPDEVYFTSVAGEEVIDNLKTFVQKNWRLIPIQMSAQKDCCGLVSGYTKPSALGDDRWMAMQGALGYYSDPCIVIDAGTALTIDAILDGRHLGGFIVPGLKSLRSALATDTADLQMIDSFEYSEEGDENETLLAKDTNSAILGGTLYMTASFINQVIHDLNEQVGTSFKVVLTGGDSSRLKSLIDCDVNWVPDLVLQGMVNIEECIKN